MSYQSEAQLEQQLIENLCERGYERVTICLDVENILAPIKSVRVEY